MTLDGGVTTTTNTSGYYSFTGVSCFVEHVVSYENTTPYLSNSSQFEQTGQQSDTMKVTVPVGTLNPILDSVSPTNNFGLVDCQVDGYIYLDINNDNLYQSGADVPLGNI